jgi:hypothetical protein
MCLFRGWIVRTVNCACKQNVAPQADFFEMPAIRWHAKCSIEILVPTTLVLIGEGAVSPAPRDDPEWSTLRDQLGEASFWMRRAFYQWHETRRHLRVLQQRLDALEKQIAALRSISQASKSSE